MKPPAAGDDAALAAEVAGLARTVEAPARVVEALTGPLTGPPALRVIDGGRTSKRRPRPRGHLRGLAGETGQERCKRLARERPW